MSLSFSLGSTRTCVHGRPGFRPPSAWEMPAPLPVNLSTRDLGTPLLAPLAKCPPPHAPSFSPLHPPGSILRKLVKRENPSALTDGLLVQVQVGLCLPHVLTARWVLRPRQPGFCHDSTARLLILRLR